MTPQQAQEVWHFLTSFNFFTGITYPTILFFLGMYTESRTQFIQNINIKNSGIISGRNTKIQAIWGLVNFVFNKSPAEKPKEIEGATDNPNNFVDDKLDYAGPLSKKQTKICQKVKEISGMYQGKEVDLREKYENSVKLINTGDCDIAAAGFIEIFREIVKVFEVIVKDKAQKDLSLLQTKLGALEKATKDYDEKDEVLKGQIDYCERASWSLLISFES